MADLLSSYIFRWVLYCINQHIFLGLPGDLSMHGVSTIASIKVNLVLTIIYNW